MYQECNGCRSRAGSQPRIAVNGGTASATCLAYGDAGSAATALVVIAPQSWPSSTDRSSPPSSPCSASASPTRARTE
jgi:hypothetical protein